MNALDVSRGEPPRALNIKVGQETRPTAYGPRNEMKQAGCGRTAVGAMIGLAIGTVAGYVAGMIIHSDNLPFLLALGSLVGLCGGLTAGFSLLDQLER